jgi:hypothetical protein
MIWINKEVSYNRVLMKLTRLSPVQCRITHKRTLIYTNGWIGTMETQKKKEQLAWRKLERKD